MPETQVHSVPETEKIGDINYPISNLPLRIQALYGTKLILLLKPAFTALIWVFFLPEEVRREGKE